MGTHQASTDPQIKIQGLGCQAMIIHPVKTAQPVNNELGGTLKQYFCDSSGSAVMSINMNDYYRAARSGETYPDQGIRCHRSIGVDYSGLSGYHALYAVTDEMSGSSGESLNLEFPGNTGVTVSSNTFSASYPGGAVINGIVAAPGSVTLAYASNKITSSPGKQFFVVWCLHNGLTPVFNVTGTGMASVVQVGSQQVSYSDSIIHFNLFNPLPMVALTQPVPGSVFVAGDTLTLHGMASDSNGTVTKVSFYDNGIFLGQDFSVPYTFSINGLTSGNHTFTAVAVDNQMAGNTSEAVTIFVATGLAPAVPVLMAELLGNSYVRLTWSDVTGEESYLIERRMNNGSYTQIATLNAGSTSFLDTDLHDTTRYIYRLAAASRNGRSDYSNEDSVQTLLTKLSVSPVAKAGKQVLIYPNPSSCCSTVEFNLSAGGAVTFEVYSITGMHKKTFNSGTFSEGTQRIAVNWDLPAGIYIVVVLMNDNILQTVKLILQ